MEANDMKAMREALECVLDDYADDSPIAEMIRAALKNPPRNCDVGTVEEQAKRFCSYCEAYFDKDAECLDCPLFGETGGHCELAWAQLPYESEVNNGSK